MLRWKAIWCLIWHRQQFFDLKVRELSVCLFAGADVLQIQSGTTTARRVAADC
jgi:hypothetical protein